MKHSMPSGRIIAFVLACALLALALLPGCVQQQAASADDGPGLTDLSSYPASDMSGYATSEGYEAPYRYVDMKVSDVASLMDQGASFALYCGFSDCPWCNVVMNTLNDVATERGALVGYIDTRADPSWESNLDIDNYDTFVELFGDVLDEDDEGIKHLYVPHVFFVCDGKLVYDRPGTVPEQKEPEDTLTESQYAQIADDYRSGFDAIS